jgi:hypothetical protein
MKKIILILLLMSIKLQSQVVLPSGGEDFWEWYKGNTVQINWMKGLVTDDINNKVDVILWNAGNNTETVLVQNTEDDGNFEYKVSPSLFAGKRYKIRIKNSKEVYNMISEDYFEIRDFPSSIYIDKKNEAISKINLGNPYPNPSNSSSNNVVTTLIYWEAEINIDNSEIAVYDITGNKVSGKENLTLEKLNEWSGNIKWNCVGQPKGTYLIKIQHGNNTKTVKVVVN